MTIANSRLLNGIKVQVLFKKHIENKYQCGPRKNCYYCFKSNIRINNLIVGSRIILKVSKNMSL